MNNLRGDMRSIDARREELADLVGFREAEETPEGVSRIVAVGPLLSSRPRLLRLCQCACRECHRACLLKWPEWLHLLCPPVLHLRWRGIGGLPMDQGPAPMAMANGGMVQYFQDGSGPRGALPNLIQLLQTLDCPHTLLKRFRQR